MKKTKPYKTIGKVRLVREQGMYPQTVIKSSITVNEIVRELFPDTDICEYFYMLSLNRANKIMDFSLISQGGLTATVVDVRMIAKLALETLATSVIFIHNHPSGNLQPSAADLKLTKRLKEGLALLDITVLDHMIIVPDGKYYSMGDEGTL